MLTKEEVAQDIIVLALIIFMVWLINSVMAYTCGKKFENYETEHTIFTGCLIRVSDNTLIPDENFRINEHVIEIPEEEL